MAYRRVTTIDPVEARLAVPTVRELLRAIRRHAYPTAVAYSDGARCIEAGIRVGHNGDHTTDSTLWPEDEDLFDFENIADVLKDCRKTDPDTWPKALDVYVRDTEELLGNVELRPGAPWTIVTTHLRFYQGD